MSNELRIFVPMAIRVIMNNLGPRMEAAARVSVTQLIDLNPAIPKRISAGEAYDIGLTNPRYAKALIVAGHADGESHRAFGRVPLAVGRKAGPGGAIRKDVQEIEALLGGAESIAYTGAGTSGQTYLDVMERLGLKNAVITMSRPMGGGEPVASVASGDNRTCGRTLDHSPFDPRCRSSSSLS
jgi:molybdate transport system substrate-binding protein